MNNKSTLFGVIGLVIVAGIIFFLQRQPAQAPTQTPSNNQTAVNPPPPPPPSANKVEIVVNYVTGVNFTPETRQVTEGQEVVLRVTSSVADELHLHGYDLSLDLEAGKQGSITFVANKTGRFEFELEKLKLALGVVEVYPK